MIIQVRTFKWLLLTFILLCLFCDGSNGSSDKCECTDKHIYLYRKTDYRLIFSPEYPRYYCGKLDCYWEISGWSKGPKNDSKFHFFASNIDLRDKKDYIYFYEHSLDTIKKNESDSVIASHSCTGKGLCQYDSKSDKLVIRFRSSTGFPNNNGFHGRINVLNNGVFNFIKDTSLYLIAALLTILIFGIIIIIIFVLVIRNQKMTKASAVEEKLLNQTPESL